MEDMYYDNNAGDYRNISDSTPEQLLSDNETEYNDDSCDYTNEDLLEKNNHFENKNSPNTSLQPDNFYVLQNGNKECSLKGQSKSGKVDIQHFDDGNAKSMYRARRVRFPKDKRNIQIEPKGETNSAVRPNRVSFGSASAPSILSFALNKLLSSGDGRDGDEESKRDFKNERKLTEHPATIPNQVPEKYQLTRKEKNQKIKGNQKSKIVVVQKRQDNRKVLKIPPQRIYLKDRKMPSGQKSSFDSVNEMKYIPGRRDSYETDRCSSYSESDLRYTAEQENQTYERSALYPNFQQSLRQSIPRYSINESMKNISNALSYADHGVSQKEPPTENYSKTPDNRFTTDRLLQKELSDFKEFLIHRRMLQIQNANRGPRIRTIRLPEGTKLQETRELQNRMVKTDNKKGKESDEKQRKVCPFFQNKSEHKTPRPKVSDDELWKRYEKKFRW